jgi:hypothetical protein
LRLSFMLEEKYNRYALLNERAAGCKTWTKKTLWSRPMWCFEFTEERKGRTVEMLRFKLFRKKCHERQNYNWFTFELIPLFVYLKLPPNQKWCFFKDVLQLQKHPNLIEPLNKRIKEF